MIKRQIEAFWKRRKNEWERTEYQCWLSGLYVLNAIGCSFSKKAKYPDNPMIHKRVVVEDMVLTEEEKEKYRKELFGKLKHMGRKINERKEIKENT